MLTHKIHSLGRLRWSFMPNSIHYNLQTLAPVSGPVEGLNVKWGRNFAIAGKHTLMIAWKVSKKERVEASPLPLGGGAFLTEATTYEVTE